MPVEYVIGFVSGWLIWLTLEYLTMKVVQAEHGVKIKNIIKQGE